MLIPVQFEIEIIELSRFLKTELKSSRYFIDGELPVTPVKGMCIIVGGTGGKIVDVMYWHDIKDSRPRVRLNPFIYPVRHLDKIADRVRHLLENGWCYSGGQTHPKHKDHPDKIKPNPLTTTDG